MKIRYSIILVCSFFLSCKKDPPAPTQGCSDLTLTNLPTGTDTIYNTPRFNPNNSNEIIYVQGIQSINKSYLVKRNLVTGQDIYIRVVL